MALNCPSCGGEVPHNLQYAKLVVCPTCTTSLFLEDDAVRNAGERSALVDEPSIFSLGVPFTWRSTTYVPHGRIRYDYGRGFWDEWWVTSNTGEAVWMSVDEGDIAIEKPLALEGAAPPFNALSRGGSVKVGDDSLTVTEKSTATCIGFEGELPEVVVAGEKHDYVHLSGPGGLLLTVEYPERETLVFRGEWIDPFEIETM
jgi:hypothetical protein